MILELPRKSFPLNDYPTSDGKPMAETDHHRALMMVLIETLDDWFLADPQVYVSGNLLIFYEKGNKRRHVSPDVFVVRGVPKAYRPNYLMWEEKTPNVVIELTSKTTRKTDTDKKWELYEQVLKVKEYYLFDLLEDYLKPPFQGYRRVRGKFRPIEFVDGRLPSEQLGLHLERDGTQLRLWDPVRHERVPTPAEVRARETRRAYEEAERANIEAERANSEAERANSETERANTEALRARLEAERADREAELAREQRERAEREAERAARAEAELARYRQKFTGFPPQPNGN